MVVPCHNYGRYLRTCLDSVFAQTIPRERVEIIAVDDASTDESPEILAEYAGRGVIVLTEPVNRGYVRAYRRGMALASGRLLLPLDADDLIADEDAIRSQVAMIDASDRIGFVHSTCYEVDATGRRLRVRPAWEHSGVYRSEQAFRKLLTGNSVQHTGTLMRRDAYVAVGGYDEALRNSVDWDLWLRLSRWYDVGFIDRPLYAYRLHGANMHQRVTETREERELVHAEMFTVIDQATADRPRRERRHAYAEARLLLANAHLSNFRTRDGVRSLGQAIRLHPPVTARVAFWAAIGRLALRAVIGRRGYDFIRARARSSGG